MPLPMTQIIIMGFGCIVLFVWVVIFLKSLKYASLFDSLEEKEFPFKELFCTGYCVLELVHYSYRGRQDRKNRDRLEILYAPKYADFYLRVNCAQKITYAMLMFVCAFIFYGISGEIVMLIMFVGLSGFIYYYYGNITVEMIQKRIENMIDEFSEVVSKLALLINAGMILREAWERIAFSAEGDLYKEMQIVVENMNNGVSEAEAIRRFGVRCMMSEIKKFSSTIIQGIEKGNRELAIMLQQQNSEVWEMKKHWARRKAEKAASQLILPMMIMFMGILILIIVPIFTNMGM